MAIIISTPALLCQSNDWKRAMFRTLRGIKRPTTETLVILNASESQYPSLHNEENDSHCNCCEVTYVKWDD